MLTGLLIFLSVVILLLAIPVEVQFAVVWPGTANNEIAVTWAFDLVRAKVPAGNTRAAPGRDPRLERRRKTGRSPSIGDRSSGMLAALAQRPFRRRILRFAGDLWRSFEKKDLRFRTRIGLGDPADTGQLWAVLGPVSGLLASLNGGSVVVEPDFLDATLEFDGSGRIRFVPLRVIAVAGGLLVSPSFWRGLRTIGAA